MKHTLSAEHLAMVKIQHYKDVTGKMPIVLFNSFTGIPYFVQKPISEIES